MAQLSDEQPWRYSRKRCHIGPEMVTGKVRKEWCSRMFCILYSVFSMGFDVFYYYFLWGKLIFEIISFLQCSWNLPRVHTSFPPHPLPSIITVTHHLLQRKSDVFFWPILNATFNLTNPFSKISDLKVCRVTKRISGPRDLSICTLDLPVSMVRCSYGSPFSWASPSLELFNT